MIDTAELLEQFSQAHDLPELMALLLRNIQGLGFDYYSYYLHYPLPATRPIIHVFDTYPAGWMDYYQGEGYLDIDPTIKLSRASSDLVVWNNETFAAAKPLWSDAQAAGLRYGLAQTTFGPTMSFGVLSVARRTSPISASMVTALRMPMLWIASQFYNALVEKAVELDPPGPSAALTTREIEVLKWTLDGKTANDIAFIKGISTRTVNFHMGNILEKLGVMNKTQAAIRAFSLGIFNTV
ncbi:autoinducer binding domain-containing protein [Salinisphaera sp. RV14]|uniref:autoinducer binding domain-containing protein n=1 Tax=Salinisphaera sp. RV14 TaxID=3454140 RepID=UPI003F82F11E